MVKVCIICHQEKFGEPVEDTQTIRAIRSIKSRLGMQTGNMLVVCPNCTLIHAKKRKGFESRWMQHAVLGIAIFLVLVGLPLLSLQFSLGTTFLAAILCAGIVSLSLIDYTPPLANPQVSASALERESRNPAPAQAAGAFGAFASPGSQAQSSGSGGFPPFLRQPPSRPIIVIPDKKSGAQAQKSAAAAPHTRKAHPKDAKRKKR